MLVLRFASLLLLTYAVLGRTAQQVQTAQPPQTPAANAAKQIKPEDRCIIEGAVYSLKSLQPLGKAEITLRKAESNAPTLYEATSDSSGHYMLEDIDPGKYMLSATRNGYVNTSYGSNDKKRASTLITLATAQHLTKVDMKLPPQAVVTGRVVDESNESMANVRVELMSRAYRNGKQALQPSFMATTNDKGEYRIYGVRRGKYWALAHVGNAMVQQGEIRSLKDKSAYPATYYPGGLTLAEASQLQVEAGGELDGIDFHLVKVKSFIISGNVAIAGATHNVNVQLMPHEVDGAPSWDRMRISMVDSEGKYAFRGVQPGHDDLTANSFAYESRTSAHAEVMASDKDVEATLEFGQNPDLHGTVRSDDASEVIKPGINVMLQPESGMMNSLPSETKEDGTFTLKPVPLDRLRLRLYPLPDGHYIKSVQMGNVELPDTLIDMTNGVAGELSVVLSAKGAAISGTVQDDQQKFVSTATIVLIPDDRKLQSRYVTASPDQNGQFSMKNIHPGSYKVFAFDSAEYGVWFDSEWLKPYETKGESIEVKELQTATKKLVLIVTDES